MKSRFDQHGMYRDEDSWRLVPCRECSGTGNTTVYIPNDEPIIEDCPDCDGHGSVKEYDLKLIGRKM